jgi:uncharacterized membrane protein
MRVDVFFRVFLAGLLVTGFFAGFPTRIGFGLACRGS